MFINYREFAFRMERTMSIEELTRIARDFKEEYSKNPITGKYIEEIRLCDVTEEIIVDLTELPPEEIFEKNLPVVFKGASVRYILD
jgi:hypothetical protein